jgi:hypothetical protein
VGCFRRITQSKPGIQDLERHPFVEKNVTGRRKFVEGTLRHKATYGPCLRDRIHRRLTMTIGIQKGQRCHVCHESVLDGKAPLVAIGAVIAPGASLERL